MTLNTLLRSISTRSRRNRKLKLRKNAEMCGSCGRLCAELRGSFGRELSRQEPISLPQCGNLREYHVPESGTSACRNFGPTCLSPIYQSTVPTIVIGLTAITVGNSLVTSPPVPSVPLKAIPLHLSRSRLGSRQPGVQESARFPQKPAHL